ncbi:MAG: hypothetical protein JO139_08885 [Alphaproteobacteria bacterium]|nr:hypothetical protein [Alphaproteobacteria bacterium]
MQRNEQRNCSGTSRGIAAEPGSVTSVFGEPEDFEAALRPDGVVNLVLTHRGQFRAG